MTVAIFQWGSARHSLYEVKRAGGDPAHVALNLRLDIRQVPKGRIVLLDTVIDTGTTARASSQCALQLGLPVAVLAFAATDRL